MYLNTAFVLLMTVDYQSAWCWHEYYAPPHQLEIKTQTPSLHCVLLHISVISQFQNVCLFPWQLISVFSAFSTHRTLAVQVCRWGTEKASEPGEVPAERAALAKREWCGELSGQWSRVGSVNVISFVCNIIRWYEIYTVGPLQLYFVALIGLVCVWACSWTAVGICVHMNSCYCTCTGVRALG